MLKTFDNDYYYTQLLTLANNTKNIKIIKKAIYKLTKKYKNNKNYTILLKRLHMHKTVLLKFCLPKLQQIENNSLYQIYATLDETVKSSTIMLNLVLALVGDNKNISNITKDLIQILTEISSLADLAKENLISLILIIS
ncbi:MAG: hypothetical protein QXU98_13035 [Candidatus Parvarchaeota archaeon]